MLRVLFVNDTARNGGPGRSLHAILKFLDPRAVHRTVLLPREGAVSELILGSQVADEIIYEPGLVENPFEPWHRAIEREDFRAPLPVRALRLAGNGARAVRAWSRLRRHIAKRRYDLVYCNGTTSDFVGGLLARWGTTPVLWHVRYTSVPRVLTPLHSSLAAHRNVRRVLCVSHEAAKLFPPGASKVHVLNNALDTDEFDVARVTPVLRRELRLRPDAVVFGSHGRVLRRKGYVEFVRAARQALLAVPEPERLAFVVVGDTPADVADDHLGECKRLVHELGLQRQFFFVGFRADPKPWVADFDVAVVPSVYPDPLPRAVIESMALGRPVIAFDVGGVSEMIDHGLTGALVAGSPPDVDALAAQIVAYADDPARRQDQGAAARRAVLERFDGRAHGRAVYEHICAAAGRR